MADNKDRKIIPTPGGLWNNMTVQIKLIMRLMADKRVSPLIKLLPLGSLVYFLVPDLVLGPIDDVAVIWLGTYLFLELAPPDIVEEHMRILTGQADPQPFDSDPQANWPPQDAAPKDPPPDDEDVIEGEFWEKKD
jgi:hypothetical protein